MYRIIVTFPSKRSLSRTKRGLSQPTWPLGQSMLQRQPPCAFRPASLGPCMPSTLHWRRYLSSDGNNKDRPDPFARRPNAKCDPYGQGGKPLPLSEAKALLVTLEPQWKIEEHDDDDDDDDDNGETTTSSNPPKALVREFVHPDFVAGSRFVSKIAAVAQLNIHFPSIQLERRIVPNKKAWQVVTTIRCRTLVLGGLSTHDFHLAMLIDVESARPEVKELISQDDNSSC